MLGFTATCGLAALFWLSHHIHRSYLNAIAREERWLGRGFAHRPAPRHWGPKLFLLVDFLTLCGIAWSVRAWLPIFLFGDETVPLALAETLLLGSGLIAGWLVIEARHMQGFYQRMIRSVRTPTRQRARLAFHDQILGDSSADAKRVFVALLLAWATLPLVMASLGVHLISERSSQAEVLLWLGAGFIVPLTGLSAFVGARLLRLRNTLYR